MAKKPTEKQLYKLKNEWLGQFFEEVKPKEFYRAVFPEGSFERAGHFEDGKANGIITIVENDEAKNRIVFDDLSVIDEVKGQDERSATALDCVPPWSLPVTWLGVKGQYADRLRSGNPLHPLCPGHSPCRGAVKDCFPLPMAMWGSGQSPENGSRDLSLVGVKGQTAPAPGGHEKLSLSAL